jgi:hypothetical protein
LVCAYHFARGLDGGAALDPLGVPELGRRHTLREALVLRRRQVRLLGRNPLSRLGAWWFCEVWRKKGSAHGGLYPPTLLNSPMLFKGLLLADAEPDLVAIGLDSMLRGAL